MITTAMWTAHGKEGVKRFGKRRWDNATIGWGVDEVNEKISSKVYGKPCMILTTTKLGRSYLHDEEVYA